MYDFNVTEIIYSIQGESSFIGYPCVLVRFAGCNLSCSYCDTEYAQSRHLGKKLSVGEIMREIESFGCKLIELTGGEPTLQDGLSNLIDILLEREYKVLIETNGSMDISFYSKEAVFIMDIKCPSSGELDKFYYANLRHLKMNDEVKFVISDKNDYLWAKQFIFDNGLSAGLAKLIFSPVYGKLSLTEIASWILDDKLNCVRLQAQFHKIIWGPDKKGV